MKHRARFFEAFSQNAELPATAVPGHPLVEIVGEHRVLIENHRGVSAYSCNEVRIKVSYGYLCVCGRNLCLSQMTRHQLVLCGCIESVTLCRGRNG